ncbi:MAG: outer membrane protein assembly factor BamB [Verrucomicrobiales bacterium]|jgi:outer membrane protein assembly factor BamB
MVVAAGRVFLANATPDGLTRSLLCFDRQSGEQIWEISTTVSEVEPTHGSNGYAASTPAAAGDPG